MKFYPTLTETLAKRFEPGTDDGMSEIRDVSEYGMSSGFSGFIYYHEINEFFNEFESEIEDVMEDLYGDNWLTEMSSQSYDMQDLRCKLVWSVVELWCSRAVDLVEAA